MRILLVADGRSPITRNWIRMLDRNKHQLYLVSTYPTDPIASLEGQFILPIGFSSFSGSQVKRTGQTKQSFKNRIVSALRPILMRVRAILAPLFLPPVQKHFLQIVKQVKPNLVHALRIPYEGMLASTLPKEIPFIVSIWGNDLSLHALSSRSMGTQSRKTLRRADGLMADAASDIRSSSDWGLRSGVPTIVVPGSGGLDLKALQVESNDALLKKFDIPAQFPLVINPRGFRPGSVHQDIFFKAIPLILEEIPDVLFICTGMAGQPQAEKWSNASGVKEKIFLLPFLPQEELWSLYKRAQIYISLSSHDGTPNSFLEAVACGCFPVVGNIPSLQEWVEQGKNGFLVDPMNAQEAANAVINALKDEELQKRASALNKRIVSDRAEMQKIGKKIINFYAKFE